VIVTYSYTSSTEEDPETPGQRREVPLTPDHVGSLNVLWENEEAGRVGLEVYSTGRQALEDNPYRSEGRPYVLFGLFGEKRFGRVRAFVNVENIGNVRQTDFDPMVRSSRAPDGRWTVDAWAPLDGFVANAGVRVAF
jgi:iron complex outermembrane receptor protein